MSRCYPIRLAVNRTIRKTSAGHSFYLSSRIRMNVIRYELSEKSFFLLLRPSYLIRCVISLQVSASCKVLCCNSLIVIPNYLSTVLMWYIISLDQRTRLPSAEDSPALLGCAPTTRQQHISYSIIDPCSQLRLSSNCILISITRLCILILLRVGISNQL